MFDIRNSFYIVQNALMANLNKLVDTYTSINDEIINITPIIAENIVCLSKPYLILSFFLSFTIVSHNFVALTANANIQGIKIIFCNNIDVDVNKIPFPVPNIATIADIVYPNEKPLNPTIPYTIGNPIIVEPVNHIARHKIILFVIDFCNRLIKFISEFSFNDINVVFTY